MPEELTDNGSGDHRPENIRRDGQIDIIRPLVNADLPMTARAGVVRRSISQRLGDFISVKDFGAKGDGSTDDRLAIVAALEALGGIDSPSRTLYFPPGVYMLNSVRRTVAQQVADPSGGVADPRQVVVSLDNPSKPSGRGTRIFGHGATIKCGFQLPNPVLALDQLNAATPYSMSQVSTMIMLVNGGGDLLIEGLKIDGDNRAGNGLLIQDQYGGTQSGSGIQGRGRITIRSCQFVNMYTRRIPYNTTTDLTLNTTVGSESPIVQSNDSSRHPVGGSVGLNIYTSSSNVVVDGCVVKNIGRDPFGGVTTISGCHGMVIYAAAVGGTETSSASNHSLYYVSVKDGNDANSGTIGSPVQTLSRAAVLARQDTSGKEIHILIRGGEYKMLGTLANPVFYLNQDDSGRAGKKIVYKAYGNEEVVITGSEKISPSAFRPLNETQDATVWNKIKPDVRPNIMVADLGSFDLGFTPPSVWNGGGNGSSVGYVTDLPAIPELFFNDKRMTVARWPNIVTPERNGYTSEDLAYVESVVERGTSGIYAAAVWTENSSTTPSGAPFVDGIFEYPASYDSVVSRWTSAVASGIWIHGFWRFDWADEVYRVVNINTTSRHITVRSGKSQYALQEYTMCDPDGTPNPEGSYFSSPGKRRWYAFNLPEELDAPEEYLIDIAEKKLYFYPPQNIHANSSIRLSHRAAGGPTEKGESLSADRATTNRTESGLPGGDDPIFPYPGWAPGTSTDVSLPLTQIKHFWNTRDILKSLFKFHKVKDVSIEGLIFRDCTGSGIELNMCESITINKCKVFNMRRDGIAAMGGKNVTIQKCEVYDIGRSAVINTGGNRQTLTAANKVVTECSIKRWGKLKPNETAGLIMNGVGNKASKNLFSDGNTAILCYGNDNIIELNHFHNLLADVDDQGCIYNGANISNINNKVKNNFFNNIVKRLSDGLLYPSCETYTGITIGVYLDGNNSNQTISENVFYGCKTEFGAVFFNGGVFNTVEDNIFVECGAAYGSTNYSTQYWQTFLNSQGDVIFNKQNYGWFEDGQGTEPPRIVGYSPYNWVVSSNGQMFFVSEDWKGVMNTVDIRTPTYQSKYPQLATFIEEHEGNPRLVPSQIPYMKNTANRNVIVNCTNANHQENREEEGFATVGGWVVTNQTTNLDQGIFVNPNAKNFKLTPSGLADVRAAVGQDFPDIPFESIPKVDYVPEKYSNIVDYQGQKTVTVRNCHIENVYNKDGWGNYEPLTTTQAIIGEVSLEAIGNPGSSVVWIPSGTGGYWASANTDADGILVFAGDRRITSGLEEYDNCSASIVGNHFVNCKGRDVKAQMEEVVIQANISHNSIKPVEGGGNRMNCQIGCGQVCDNIFHFETAKLQSGAIEGDGNPFSDIPGDRSWGNPSIYEQVDLYNSRISAGTSVISFYAGRRLPRNRGITITGNHVYNNVSGTGGYLGNLFVSTEGTINSDGTLNPAPTFPNEPKPVLCSVSQNKMVGRVDSQSQMFGHLGTRGTGTQSSEVPVTPVYYIINDNMMNNLLSGNETSPGFPTSTFLSFADGSANRNFVKCDGNVHARIGSQHPRVAARRPNNNNLDFTYDGNLSATDNRNISSPYYSRSTSNTSFGSRIETLASSDGESDGVRVRGFLKNSNPGGDANYGRILLKGMDSDPLSCIVMMSTKDWWEQAGGVFFVSGIAMSDGTCLHPINSAGASTVGGLLVFSKTIFSGTSRPPSVDGKVVLWLSQEQDADALSAGANTSYLASNPAFYLNFINRLDDTSPSVSRRFTFSVFG